jgi:dsDNA-specific endonuclease/ATPase MutS2
MVRQTYHVLKFDRRLQILSGYAFCPLGQSDCLSLKPSIDLKVIEYEQELVSEVKLLLKLKGVFPSKGLIDIATVLDSCGVGVL